MLFGNTKDVLVEATGHEHNTMPDAVEAKLKGIEQGKLVEGQSDEEKRISA